MIFPEEPILGKTYLPRKFKTAVVIPPLNDVDCYGNDLDFVAIADENGNLVGLMSWRAVALSLDMVTPKPIRIFPLNWVMCRWDIL